MNPRKKGCLKSLVNMDKKIGNNEDEFYTEAVVTLDHVLVENITVAPYFAGIFMSCYSISCEFYSFK